MLSKRTVLTDSLAILIEMENPHDDSSSSGFHYDVITRFQFGCLSITIHPLLSLLLSLLIPRKWHVTARIPHEIKHAPPPLSLKPQSNPLEGKDRRFISSRLYDPLKRRNNKSFFDHPFTVTS